MQAITFNTLKKLTVRATKIGIFIALPNLSGCLLISPFWNQQFANHNNAIPMQTFTMNNSYPVKFECAKAAHFGLYPSADAAVWVSITSAYPSANPAFDPLGASVYTAGINTALPASCWRQDPANSIWYAAIRATQSTSSSGTTQFQTFTKAGLECLGREVGKATSWTGWINKNCAATYSGSTTTIPYTIVYSAN